MTRRQKKKLYKKLCDKYNMPYSSFPKNRENKTMCKRETKMVSQKLLSLRDIVRVYSKVGLSLYKNPEPMIVDDLDRHSLYPRMIGLFEFDPNKIVEIVAT